MIRSEPVSIVMPAYRARQTIMASVTSALAQDFTAFELIIVADDGEDYEAVLGRAGIADPRIRYLQSGHIGGGSPPARNKGLDAARFRFSAILDADDRFAPGKLGAAMPHALTYGMVSCALSLVLSDGRVLRQVAAGPDQILGPDRYKFTNFSMDSMLVYDRRRADPRFDPQLPCMTDLDFVLKLFAAIPACYHLGTPYHDYVKLPVSVSNGPGVTGKMIATKRLLRARLAQGHYSLVTPDAIEGIDRFLAISLAAEESFVPGTVDGRPALFEDHLEPLLGR